MDARDQFFQDAIREAREFDRQELYERRVVEQLLKWADQPVAQLRREVRQRDPDLDLNLTWFAERFPRFPVRLGCQKIPYVHQDNFYIDFLKAPTKTRLWSAFDEWVELTGLVPQKDAVGFVFEYPDLGTQILHNYPRNDQIVATSRGVEPKQGRLVRPVFGVPYSIEPLRVFVTAVAWFHDDT